jgi:nucleoid DNA-binding protein
MNNNGVYFMAARKKSAKKAKTKVKSTKRKTVKKATTKKSTAKKSTKAKTTTVANTGPLGKVSSVYTKSTLLTTLSERTGLAKKEVSAVLSELTTVVEGHLKKGGPGKFTLPGMLKMTVKNAPAKKARKGINPFTGEPTVFKAKPASRKVKVTALKALKEMAS